MVVAGVVPGRRPRRRCPPHGASRLLHTRARIQHARRRWWIAAFLVLLRTSADHNTHNHHNHHVFVDASSIRRPGASSRNKNRNGNGTGGGGAASRTPLLPAHCRPNRLVAAAPLAAAAVCRDGVVLAAFHASPALEPLLVDAQEEDDDGGEVVSVDTAASPGEERRRDGAHHKENEDDSSNTRHNQEDGTPIASTSAAAKRPPAAAAVRDLPRTYRGPFRVFPVDGCGTALLAAGWRSDCHSLAARCRSLAAEEAANYGHDGHDGHGDLGSGSGSTAAAPAAAAPSGDYAAGIARDASLWLARCALSGGTRTRNCVGLLASCARDTSSCGGDSGGGRLHLIDAAGVHRARALAIGHGSDCINRRLLGVDFSDLGRDEAVRKLMDVILQSEEEKDEDDDDDDDDTNSDTQGDNNEGGGSSEWQLPKGSLVELAFVDARQMRRIQYQKII